MIETFKKHEKVCKDHDYCYVKMPDEDKKILKYNTGEKSLKVPFIIYADLEFLLRKIDTCQNDPKKSFTEKIAKHIYLQVTHGLCFVHLINQKMNRIITEKTVWKGFVKI